MSPSLATALRRWSSRIVGGLSWLLLVPALGLLVLLVPAFGLASLRGMGPRGIYPSLLLEPMGAAAAALLLALLLMGLAAALRPRAPERGPDVERP